RYSFGIKGRKCCEGQPLLSRRGNSLLLREGYDRVRIRNRRRGVDRRANRRREVAGFPGQARTLSKSTEIGSKAVRRRKCKQLPISAFHIVIEDRCILQGRADQRSVTDRQSVRTGLQLAQLRP